MSNTVYYSIFDYDTLTIDSPKKKTKCCKKYKKKGKFNCSNCPKL